MSNDPESYRVVPCDRKTREDINRDARWRGEGRGRTVVVTLVHAVGGTPLWKECRTCMVGSRTPRRDSFKVDGGNVVGELWSACLELGGVFPVRQVPERCQ